jgi:hypothetical protein
MNKESTARYKVPGIWVGRKINAQIAMAYRKPGAGGMLLEPSG